MPDIERLIVENTKIGCPGCQVERLMRSGVSVVTRNQMGLMHNKFIIMEVITQPPNPNTCTVL